MSEAPSEAFGPYLVYEQLGAGGMAQVHRAEVIGEGFHRPVALKRMLPHVAGNLDMVKAFVREAHLASQLRHANVAQTYELGKVDDTYFIAMELIRGRNLREILRQCYATTGSPMPVPVALNILNQICDALDYAHNLCDERGQPLGIIHRDVSPSNVIVAEGGVVKLIDFGIAKVSAAGMQTMSGTLKGKFGYMAPEYIDGSIDARADLFAVGVIAHELLTNRPLFSTHDDMETLCRVREMEVSPPSRRNPQVPAAVDDIVMTALARDPDRRWQHATALRNAMTTVTARCGLVVTNAKAHEWLDWLFDQTNPHSIAAPQGLTLDDGEPSIMVEHPDASGNITRIADSEPPTTALPAGTPSRMSAQASIPPPLASESQHEYRAAVARYERHDALVPTGSMLAEDVMPTSIRSSAPRIQPRGPQDINQTIAGTVPARQTPPRTLEARNAPITVDPPLRPSAPRVQAPSDPAFVAPGSGTRAPTEAIQPARNGSFAVTVILVLLAAGLAAGAVYFLLPLVT